MSGLRRDARAAREAEEAAVEQDERRRRLPAGAAAVLSLLPALLALVLVQVASPAGQRIPTGPARFDLAAAWLASEPGALSGAAWAQSPALLGRLQLGVLLRAAADLQGAGVLVAAQTALLVLAVAQALLLWLLLRRIGLQPAPAGLATAVFGVAPAAVAAHATPTSAGVAVVWLLAAALLTTRSGRIAPALAGAAAVLAVASSPLALPPVLVGAVVLARRRADRPRVLAGAAGSGAALLAVAGTALLCAALPATAAARALNAVTGAQPPVAPGAATLGTWATSDPVGLLVAIVALAVAARDARTRPVAIAALLVAAASLFPAGTDPAGPLVVALPVVAVAVALAVERAVVALLQPVFARSLVGSGWLMGVGALLLVALVVCLTGLAGLAPRADRPVARVERWIAGSVPAGQTVLVGLGAWPDLAGASRGTVGWYAARPGAAAVPSSTAWTGADYVVADATLEGSRGAAGQALARSVPVARFGAGGDALTVRAVRAGASSDAEPDPSPTATPPASGAERQALAARIRVGEQLAGNPRIELSGEDRALLTAGDVDTRIALVLAQFATEHRVAVASFGVARGDASGIRSSVLISRVDDRAVPGDVRRTGDLLRFLSALRDDFATRSIDVTEDGVVASFQPDAAFVPSS